MDTFECASAAQGAETTGARSTSLPGPPHRVLIKRTRRVMVEYDPLEKTYIKHFYPSLPDRVKYLVGLREYPGLNFRRIATRLHLLGVAVPQVVEASRFSVSTKALEGRSLMEALLTDQEDDLLRLMTLYADILAATFQAGIFFGDAHFRNYMVCAGRLYALDLDNYRCDFLSGWLARRMMRPVLRKQLPLYVAKLHRRALKTQKPEVIGAVNRCVRAESIDQLLETRLNAPKAVPTKTTRRQ